jgi:hypothetical protein
MRNNPEDLNIQNHLTIPEDFNLQHCRTIPEDFHLHQQLTNPEQLDHDKHSCNKLSSHYTDLATLQPLHLHLHTIPFLHTA